MVNLVLKTPFSLRIFTDMEETTWKLSFGSLAWQGGQESTGRAHLGVESYKPSITLVQDPKDLYPLEKGELEDNKLWTSLTLITKESRGGLNGLATPQASDRSEWKSVLQEDTIILGLKLFLQTFFQVQCPVYSFPLGTEGTKTAWTKLAETTEYKNRPTKTS